MKNLKLNKKLKIIRRDYQTLFSTFHLPWATFPLIQPRFMGCHQVLVPGIHQVQHHQAFQHLMHRRAMAPPVSQALQARVPQAETLLLTR